MTPRLEILPDAIQISRAWLLTVPEVAVLCTQFVSTDSPADTTVPWVRLTRVPGRLPPVRQRLDRATIQVDCFDPAGSPSASLLARTCRAALCVMPGWAYAGGLVTSVDDSLSLRDLPDDSRTPPTPRWLFGVDVCIRTNP